MKKKKPVFVVLLFIVCLAVFSVLAGLIFLKSEAKPVDLTSSASIDYEVKKGMTARHVANELKEKGIIRNSSVFYIFARYPELGSLITGAPKSVFKVSSGLYTLKNDMSIDEIFSEISSGKEKSVMVSIPEGLTVSKVAQRLINAGLKNAEDFEFVATHNGKEIFEKHNIPVKADSVEGFLYPDTYSIPLSYNSEKIIGLMVENFKSNVAENSETSFIQSVSGDELYRKVILASIVEREYRAESEASLIASVFYNRLSINMPLQSCATVEYIITEINHKPHPDRIYFSDLEIKNPFNTYKYPGLTPSPICSPGITALKAACAPAKSDYLYFTLTDSDAGRHTFSSNLDSHVKATNEFRTKRDANN